ncbi:Hypothetical protein PAS_chr2-2_0007 [Komagataella phaffii GS115]|uniref:Uncharacterized protein n=2 Tax=Komagataella phaffii TaxID=460519 RepID=C4R355_KOMPG|nr:Hypothetical protein PAS_chr2-2_0007 [Komagataella phaffii GS115]CAY69929.1 Hypothetical protein PAS_chr2-2_0007 [Komagataella phaffii GS115]
MSGMKLLSTTIRQRLALLLILSQHYLLLLGLNNGASSFYDFNVAIFHSPVDSHPLVNEIKFSVLWLQKPGKIDNCDWCQ